ncbi:hypothetical protein GCK72_004082 [Caenorhabditis remanei]|uniref:Domain of unknown function WSN domain-containing protein n=1 Tax=Caenorhabditis remanei TaxID=31234 RepID=A0A6A5HAC0_CAERE|nr:hypothetical protein GCK72_004082 [Caenorhabditis remanei]KAF1764135.1 hypothetical protein GCK72_004082 [Caenorhabditis remanei]
MWLSLVSTFLLFCGSTSSTTHGNFQLKDVYHKTVSIPETAEKLYLESQLLTGKVTPINLTQSLFERPIDETTFEEYSKMEIYSGLKEHNEISKMLNEAKKSTTTDEMRAAIGDGLKALDGYSNLKSFIEEIDSNAVISDIQKTEERSKVNLAYGFWMRDEKKYLLEIIGEIKEIIENLQSIAKENKELDGRNKTQVELRLIDLHRAMGHITNLSDLLRMAIKMNSVFFESNTTSSFNTIKNALDEVMGKLTEVKNLEGLIEKLNSMKSDMALLEKLRWAVSGVRTLEQNLKATTVLVERIKMSKEKYEKYQKIDSISSVLHQIVIFSKSMKILELRSFKMSDDLKPFLKHFEDFKIPDRNLTTPFDGLHKCLEAFDFKVDFSTEKSSLEATIKQFSKIEAMDEKFKESWDKLVKYTDEKEYDGLTNLLRNREYNREKLVEQLSKVNVTELQQLEMDLNVTINGRAGEPMTYYEKTAREIQDLLVKVEYDKMRKETKVITDKLNNVKQFLDCHSDLNISIDDTVALMDIPKETWNFNPLRMLGLVDIVSLFKDAYEKMVEIRDWKLESNPSIENFLLDSEDVKAMYDGKEAFESVMRIHEYWEEMEDWDEEEFEGHDVEWKSIRDGVSGLVKSLGQLKSNSELSDVQELIATIQFPVDMQIDEFKTFIRGDYEGSGRFEILKVLKDLEKLKTDFPDIAGKLEKMNQSIAKMKEWEEKEHPKTVDQKEPFVDCAVSHHNKCNEPLTLPDGSLEPLKKVEL